LHHVSTTKLWSSDASRNCLQLSLCHSLLWSDGDGGWDEDEGDDLERREEEEAGKKKKKMMIRIKKG
jgi:hypothetical protein